ncbi:ATP-binding protein [Streptomyces xinghaiensis]|uniref:ATP-binding protein n=1 Tax=Streptomyces xinghaiensis TaxID=1038928 RepID=UPI0034428C4C
MNRPVARVVAPVLEVHPRDPASPGDAAASPLRAGTRTGSGRPAYTATLPRTAESAPAARQLVSSALRVWDLEELEHAAHIVVTELVSNAAAHARRQSIRVTVTRLDRLRARVAVVDMSRELPRPRPAEADDESGRGLTLVAALSGGCWGVAPLPWGKRVWADLAADEEGPGE